MALTSAFLLEVNTSTAERSTWVEPHPSATFSGFAPNRSAMALVVSMARSNE